MLLEVGSIRIEFYGVAEMTILVRCLSLYRYVVSTHLIFGCSVLYFPRSE